MTAPRLQAWVRAAPLGRGRWMAALGGFLAVQVLSLLAVAEWQGRTADPRPGPVAAALLAALAGLLLAGAGLPLMAHARRVRRWRQRYLLRLQDARAWFVQGRLPEPDLEEARRALEEAAEGRFPGEARRTAGDLLRRTGLLAAAWSAVAAWAAWRLGPGAARAALLAAAGLALLAGSWAAARGWPLWSAGKAATAEHLARLDAQEREMLRKARAAPPPGPDRL